MSGTTYLSNYCKKIREEIGLSVLAFSKEKGVSHTYIQYVESGKYDKKPSSTALARIIAIYDMDIDYAMQLARITQRGDYREDIKYYLENKATKSKKILNIANLAEKFTKYLVENNYIVESEFSITNYQFNKNNKYDSLINYDIRCYKDCPCYVYFVDELTTTQTDKDVFRVHEYFRNLMGSIVLKHGLGRSNLFHPDIKEAEIMIVTSSEKIMNEILFEYKNTIHWLDEIDIQLFYCRPKRETKGPFRLNEDYYWKDANQD